MNLNEKVVELKGVKEFVENGHLSLVEFGNQAKMMQLSS